MWRFEDYYCDKELSIHASIILCHSNRKRCGSQSRAPRFGSRIMCSRNFSPPRFSQTIQRRLVRPAVSSLACSLERGGVQSLAFSSDGNTLATLGRGREIVGYGNRERAGDFAGAPKWHLRRRLFPRRSNTGQRRNRRRGTIMDADSEEIDVPVNLWAASPLY